MNNIYKHEAFSIYCCKNVPRIVAILAQGRVRKTEFVNRISYKKFYVSWPLYSEN